MLAILYPCAIRELAREDGVFEVLQTFTLLGCAIFAAYIGAILHRKKKLWSLAYYGASVVFVFVAGEEISWGQRFVGFETPEWLGGNLQGEANIHNLPGVTNTLFTGATAVLCVIIVISFAFDARLISKRAWMQAELWVPSSALIPAWLCVLSYPALRALDTWWYELDRPHITVSRLQEPMELILYGGVLIFLGDDLDAGPLDAVARCSC